MIKYWEAFAELTVLILCYVLAMRVIGQSPSLSGAAITVAAAAYINGKVGK